MGIIVEAGVLVDSGLLFAGLYGGTTFVASGGVADSVSLLGVMTVQSGALAKDTQVSDAAVVRVLKGEATSTATPCSAAKLRMVAEEILSGGTSTELGVFSTR